MPTSSSKPADLAVGDSAPAFSLPDQTGKLVRLADFQHHKNVVLIFYPGDMTPGCTIQLCAIRDDWSKFDAKDTVVYGVNHGDEHSHATFIKKYALPFPLLIDADKKVSARYGAIKTFFKAIVIKRSVVIINKEGIIVYLKRGMPKNADILKHLPN